MEHMSLAGVSVSTCNFCDFESNKLKGKPLLDKIKFSYFEIMSQYFDLVGKLDSSFLPLHWLMVLPVTSCSLLQCTSCITTIVKQHIFNQYI